MSSRLPGRAIRTRPTARTSASTLRTGTTRSHGRLADATSRWRGPARCTPRGAFGAATNGSYGIPASAASERDVVADLVVLAAPFTNLRKIDLERSGLSPLKRECIQKLGMGTNAKVLMQFRSQAGALPPLGRRADHRSAVPRHLGHLAHPIRFPRDIDHGLFGRRRRGRVRSSQAARAGTPSPWFATPLRRWSGSCRGSAATSTGAPGSTTGSRTPGCRVVCGVPAGPVRSRYSTA